MDNQEKEVKKKNKNDNSTYKEIKKEQIIEETDEENVDRRTELQIDKKNGFNTLEVIIIMFITLCFGCFLGSVLTIGKSDNNNITSSNIPKELQEFVKTYEDILDSYYDKIDNEKLLDAGIEGMVKFLGDKYSVYMDPKETESFNQQVEGTYEGIGCELKLQKDETVVVSKVFDDTPSSKAGLKIGDIIYKVEGENVIGLTPADISTKVKGTIGTSVKITVLRNDKEIEFNLKRSKIDIPSVTSKMYEQNNKKIGYIEIDVFASNTATQFKKELNNLEKSGIDSLIIDVRGNSGGYLSTVKEILSVFLDQTKIIYQLDTRGEMEKIFSNTKEYKEYPIVVLIDGYSASASEILTAALMESYGADSVGKTTYGKGTVQKAYQLSSGATVKYTIQRWLTPNGNWINETGIEPTYEISLEDEYYENPIDENDTQLQKAIEILSNK